MHVPGDKREFDTRRNTSAVRPVDPRALEACLSSLQAFRRNDPALVRWIEEGHPNLTEDDHLIRFGAPYGGKPRRR